MSAADRTEKVLRDIHVLFSKAEPYNGSKRDVIVNKNEMMDLLKELNGCMYDMMDEHELSQTKKDKANREMQKQGDDIIFAASRSAEDIYAASIMYTDNALNDIQQIIDDAGSAIAKIYENAKEQMASEKRTIKANQSELKSQLGDLIDTQKYLRLIEDENRRLQIEREKGGKSEYVQADTPSYANVQPEIRINKDYFVQNGIPLDDDAEEKPTNEELTEKEAAALSEDLDKEYFAWKESEDTKEKKPEEGKGIFSLFGRK